LVAYRLPARIVDALKLIATMKGFRVSEAAEQAPFDWIERNRPRAAPFYHAKSRPVVCQF
jgi:hypothetical protein